MPDNVLAVNQTSAVDSRQNSLAGSSQQQSHLIRQARWVMLALGVIVGLMQILQHFQYGAIQPNLFLFAEIIFYIVVLPLVGSFFLSLLSRSELARLQASQALTQQYALVRHLSGTVEWDELLGRVVEFPSFFLPASSIALYLHNSMIASEAAPAQGIPSIQQVDRHGAKRRAAPVSARPPAFSLMAFWGQGAAESSHIPTALASLPEPAAPPEPGCRFYRTGGGTHERQHWCLQLCLGEQAVGLLQIILNPGQAPTPSQIEVLAGVATDLALVIDRAVLRSTALSQAEANQAERKEIARELHDTLAQNIAYLRLKLEELVLEDNPTRQIVLIRKELGRMRDTADEAYGQVREALANLHGVEQRDLAQVLLERARTIGERAGFTAELRQRGSRRPLDPECKRQVTYICREAITNIEKHARASQVILELHWGGAGLELDVIDNGVGFDPSLVQGRDHYGLTIMQERAAAASGQLLVFSAPGGGTTISLRLPYKVEKTSPSPLLDKVSNEASDHR